MTTKITNKNFSSVSNIGVQWQSVIVSDGSTATTGVAGLGYFINTTSAAHTFILPAIATAGDTISIKDYAATFATNKLTINRNGHNIQGAANNSQIGTNRASVTLVYIDGTRGWEFTKESNVADLQVNTFISATGGTVTTSGNFKIHSFTGDGCFVVATIGAGPSGGPANVDYLVVAGGGGGASGGNGGGGGAGGYRTTFPSPGCNAGSFPISLTTFPITVGAGGAVNPAAAGAAGNDGTPSIFSTITSAGGGGGGSNQTVQTNGRSGGSGGGGAQTHCNPALTFGAGNTPPVSPPQGNPGGAGVGGPGGFASGGGGGASAAGATGGQPGPAGAGGAGSANSITGSPVTYSGGGGGGKNNVTFAPGGAGGGGAGAKNDAPNTSVAVAGSVNTGGGGGGGVNLSSPTLGVGQAGGSGIVIIRYKFQ